MPTQQQRPNARLAQLRRERGWTQDDVARRIAADTRQRTGKTVPINADYVSRLERGLIGRPRSDYREAFRNLFGTTDADLGFAPRPTGPSRPGASPVDRRRLFQLPPGIPDFIGRSAAVDTLIAAVTARTDRGVSIAAISGPPGVGKSALALHVAHAVRAAFPDGQLYAELRGIEPTPAAPADILGRFLTELGIDAGSIPDHVDDRARLLRTELGHHKVLMVLDNAADERQVRPLLPGNAACAVLVTSRKRLVGLEGADHLPLQVMTEAESRELLDRTIGAARTHSSPAATDDVARLCGWLPLALRIAGSRLADRSATPLAAYAERLSDEQHRLDMLEAGDLEVRASFALSYDACDDATRRAFRLLGVIESTDFAVWPLALLAETDPFEAETLLENLVDARLLEIAADCDTAHVQRYRFHDLLRVFARERLAAEEGPQRRRELVERLLTEYVRLGSTAAATLEPGGPFEPVPAFAPAAEQLSADPLGWLQSERAAYIRGVSQAYEADLWELSWRLAELLPACWGSTGSAGRIARRQGQQGLAAARRAGSEAGEARIRSSLGALHHAQAQYDHAAAELECSIGIFTALGDEFRAAIARRQLGDTYRHTGQLDRADTCYLDALAVFDRLRNDRMVAATLNGLGDAYRGLSRWPEATDALTRSIELYDRAGDRLESARATVRLGCVYRDQARHTEAERLYHRALVTLRDLGDRRWEARALRHLGIVYRNAGRPDQAMTFLAPSLELMQEVADPRGVAMVLRNIGDTYRHLGDLDRAHDALSDALLRFVDLGDRRSQARTRVRLADVARRRRDWAEADTQLVLAHSVFDRLGNTIGLARLYCYRGLLERDRGHWTAALEALHEAEALLTGVGTGIWQARVLAARARVERAAGKPEWADSQAAAEQICRDCGARTPDELRVWLRDWW